ncbi:MAG: peptide ABC transporter substrate-binding protein [Clostridiales bacterium]|jgi:oligopeptide transport system substrate-binding protein|nr:peptide ABC transporter substrate-binding protein [Clostridiales bacterium]
MTKHNRNSGHNRRRALLAAVLSALLLLAALAGCSGGAETTTTAAATTAAAEAATTEAATTAAEATTAAATTASDTTAAAVAQTTDAAQTTVQIAASGSGSDFDLRLCIAAQANTIDPQLSSAMDSAVMLHHLYEGLMKWVDDGAGNAILAPGQAESYDKVENADGTITYTFHLRDGIKWSDGQPVTAQDFVNGMQRLVTPATAADYSYIVDGIIVNAHEIMNPTNADAIAATPEGQEPPAAEYSKQPQDLAVTAPDDKTLTITTVTECPYFEELLAFPPLFPTRKDVIDEHGDQWTFSPATYISNGPYKMSAWEQDSFIEMVKSENHYDYENLGPRSIRFALMADANAMYAAFNNGELDFIEQLPVDEIPKELASGRLTVVDYIGTYYVSFQVQKAPFDDARIREAFTLAIDRNHIVTNITRTGQKPASGFVPAGIRDADPSGDDFRTQGGPWYSVAEADYAANCERARTLLADAGYPGGQGFPTVEYLYNTNDNHRAIAEALQADWERELGVTVTIANQEWGVFLETRKNGEYQIARNGWIGDYNDPISFLEMWVSGSGNNDAQYRNPAFDQLILDSRTETDPAKRMQILHDAEKLMQDDFMLGPIYFYTQMYMKDPAIKGMYYTPLGYFLFNYASR